MNYPDHCALLLSRGKRKTKRKGKEKEGVQASKQASETPVRSVRFFVSAVCTVCTATSVSNEKITLSSIRCLEERERRKRAKTEAISLTDEGFFRLRSAVCHTADAITNT